MSKSFGGNIGTYLVNMGAYLGRFLLLRQPRQAVRDAWADTRKLFKVWRNSNAKVDHKRAVAFVASGREHYNKKRLEKAEHDFREALRFDPAYAKAHLFLGNALYKQQKVREAKACWDRAIDVEPHSKEASEARRKLTHMRRRAADVVESIKQGARNIR